MAKIPKITDQECIMCNRPLSTSEIVQGYDTYCISCTEILEYDKIMDEIHRLHDTTPDKEFIADKRNKII